MRNDSIIDCRMFFFSSFIFFLLFFANEKSHTSVAGILNSVAIQKRLMLEFLSENCALNLTPTSNRSSPSTLPSTIASTTSKVTHIYSCLNKCGRSYDSLSSLQHHMRLECPTQAEPAIPIVKQFDCIYCNESFTRRDYLKLHTRSKHRSMIEWIFVALAFYN